MSSTRRSDWGKILADLGVSAADRQTLEEGLSSLGHALQDASPTFTQLSTELQKLKNAQPGIEEVELRPLPGNLEDLARSVDIVVGEGGGRAGPTHASTGTRQQKPRCVESLQCTLRASGRSGSRSASTGDHVARGTRSPSTPTGAGGRVPTHSGTSWSSSRRHSFKCLDWRGQSAGSADITN